MHRGLGQAFGRCTTDCPVADCPFEWSVSARLAQLPTHRRAEFSDSPPVERLVVCHGDACAPNTLIDDSGRCCGHVDLGDLGVADRWADLAVATLSLGWNYPAASPGFWEADFYHGYGVEPDERRVDYYRWLWQAGDPTSG